MRGLGGREHAPRLAITAWLALTGSALVSVILGGLALTVPMTVFGGGAAGMLAACLTALLALIGQPDPASGAVIVAHREPAAYCLPGRGSQIVLTTGAVESLDPAQMQAVLAHERAHLRGRHHLLVTLAGAPAAAFPWITGFRMTAGGWLAGRSPAHPRVMTALLDGRRARHHRRVPRARGRTPPAGRGRAFRFGGRWQPTGSMMP